MRIEDIRRKRQLNVQEQNALEKQRILESAILFRETKVRWVKSVLDRTGIDSSRGILAYSNAVPCGGDAVSAKAMWVTADGRFISMEATITNGDDLIELEAMSDVTDNISISAHERGTGKSFGLLSFEVLRELIGEG